MSTKNLARTPIEGGRGTHNKFERRQEQRRERAAKREALGRVKLDPEQDDMPKAQRRPVRPEFSDKLSTLYRFLDANLNRPWRLVYKELRAKYDARTTPGRHILFDHLLRAVKGSGQHESMHGGHQYYDYYVSEAGLLMKRKGARVGGKQRTRLRPKQQKPPSLREIAKWLNGTRGHANGVVLNGNVLYWAVPTDNTHYLVEVVGDHSWSKHLAFRRLDQDGKPAMRRHWVSVSITLPSSLVEAPDYHHPHFRPIARMDKHDIEFYQRLPKNIKEWLAAK